MAQEREFKGICKAKLPSPIWGKVGNVDADGRCLGRF